MENKCSSAVEITLSFLLGTATGFILGVLFAPASGEETRKKVQDQALKSGKKIKESYEHVSKEAEKGINIVKEKTSEGIGAIKDFVERKKEELSKKKQEPINKEEE